MGCTQTKHSKSSPQALEKLKHKHGYQVNGSSGSRPVIHKHSGKEPRKVVRYGVVTKAKDFAGDQKRVPFNEPERNKSYEGVESVSRTEQNKIGGDGLVNGWPEWLVKNISSEVLEGFVPKTADSYEKIAKIGRGTYSNVYKALDRDTGKIVALKKVRFDTSEAESVKFMAREIVMLKKLDHPNIIKLEGIVTSRMQYSLYLVFDFMLSDLTRIISRPGEKLNEAQVKCYMQQLLSGLQHCHESEILHRDIKASNLLIDKSGMLKIADFGLANFFPPREKRALTNRVVTLWYRAPELLLGSTDYGVGIDLWSAGCLLAEMFVGRPIMPGKTEVEQLHKIYKLCGSPSEDYWEKMKLKRFDPPQKYAPSFQESFAGFPTSAFGLLTTLLSLDPAHRGTAASALQNEFFTSYPLACDLCALPMIHGDDDESTKATDKKKRVSWSKRINSFRMNIEPLVDKDGMSIQARRESESSKEESSAGTNPYSQETRNSTSSTSSSYRTQGSGTILPISLSPIHQPYHNQSSKTEGHPNALKNIKNHPILQASTLLQASVTDIINPKEGNVLAHFHRSLSTLDFRTLDLYKMSRPFEPDKV